jgi:hypothetical protein
VEGIEPKRELRLSQGIFWLFLLPYLRYFAKFDSMVDPDPSDFVVSGTEQSAISSIPIHPDPGFSMAARIDRQANFHGVMC